MCLFRWYRIGSSIIKTNGVCFLFLCNYKSILNINRRVKYDEPCWSLTQPNQSTTSTVISTSSIDDPMVNCISQPIKLDDLILITEPRSLADMGDVSSFLFYLILTREYSLFQQDPSEHLVHRMTRVVLAISFDETLYLLNRLFVHTGYTAKRTAGNQVRLILSLPLSSIHIISILDYCCNTR